MILETKDLIIKRTVFEDLDTFYVWERMPEVTKFFSIKDDQTKEEILEKYYADKADPSADQFSVFFKEADGSLKLIGRIVLGDIIEGWKGEIWRIYFGDFRLQRYGSGPAVHGSHHEVLFR